MAQKLEIDGRKVDIGAFDELRHFRSEKTGKHECWLSVGGQCQELAASYDDAEPARELEAAFIATKAANAE